MTPPPYWNLLEVQPQEWWAIDAGSGTAYSLPEETGYRLWRRYDLLAYPLLGALESGTGEGTGTFVDLEFLGVTTRFLCDDPTATGWLATQYAAAVPALRRSPDVLVKISTMADLERLHRSVLGQRSGVDVRAVASKEWTPGSPLLPIIPPIQSFPFSGRFCALHAALLSTSSGGVLICGAQRAGKTSAALLAHRAGWARMCAEEMVLIDLQGGAYGIPLPVRERTASGRATWPLASLHPCESERLSVTTVVILGSAEGKPTWTRVIGMAERLRLLTAHLRALDGPLGRATASVLTMLRGAELWLWKMRPWPLLADDLEHGIRLILRVET